MRLNSINIYIYIFFRKFQLMASTPDDGFLSSDQNINRFLCKQKLNPRYFIQLLETLPIELIRTKKKLKFYNDMV